MEFSYQVSEKDYLRAFRLASKARRPTVVKTALFWAFVAICLMLLFAVVSKQRAAQENSQEDQPPVTQPASMKDATIGNLTPLAVMGGVWAVLILFWLPYAARRQYRKDTNCHGTLTVNVTQDTFGLRSTAGTSLESKWSVFNGWYEKGGIVLLRYPNGTFQILNVVGLPETDREGLRSILAAALPQKQ